MGPDLITPDEVPGQLTVRKSDQGVATWKSRWNGTA